MSGKPVWIEDQSEFVRRCISQVNREYNGVNAIEIDVSGVADQEINDFINLMRGKASIARVGSKLRYGGRLQGIPQY
ncbi:MAG: hypothetical protein K2W82_11015 [Candidatus Obscuribacterales bacterium]|nr:hypothetical protein [Candidatus Obscuribacterales bacterium]